MKRLLVLCALFLLVVPIAAAEDFTGKWSGSFLMARPDGSPGDEKIFMNITQKAMDLTGTAGPTAEMQWPLKGKVTGNALAFDVQADGGVIKFTLTYADAHLKGDANAESNGQKLQAKIDVQRVK